MRTRDHPPTAEPRCPTCGYHLTGLPEPRCPECGERFDPSDPNIRNRTHQVGWAVWIGLGIAGASASLMLMLEVWSWWLTFKRQWGDIDQLLYLDWDPRGYGYSSRAFVGALGVCALVSVGVRLFAQERYASVGEPGRRRWRGVFHWTTLFLTIVTLLCFAEFLRPALSRA